MHVATAVYSPAVSDGFSHPFPTLALTVLPPLAVNVGAASVATLPVGVYVGSSDAALAEKPGLLIDAGGQGYCADSVLGSAPAPAPPVCHADSGLAHVAVGWHTPSA